MYHAPSTESFNALFQVHFKCPFMLHIYMLTTDYVKVEQKHKLTTKIKNFRIGFSSLA